jgi:hypothetical protein
MKRAQLVADAVAVLCPHCGEPQPNKNDGSEQWTVENFKNKRVKGTMACVSCDVRFVLTPDTKVMFR